MASVASSSQSTSRAGSTRPRTMSIRTERPGRAWGSAIIHERSIQGRSSVARSSSSASSHSILRWSPAARSKSSPALASSRSPASPARRSIAYRGSAASARPPRPAPDTPAGAQVYGVPGGPPPAGARLDLRPIRRQADRPDAGRRAQPHAVREARRARRIRRHAAAAAPQPERVLEEPGDPLRRLPPAVGSEPPRPAAARRAHDPQPRKRIPPVDLQIPAASPVPERAIVHGTRGHDPARLVEPGLEIAPRRAPFHAARQREHLGRPLAPRTAAVEVAAHPAAEVHALSDIERGAAVGLELVDAGRGRKLGGNPLGHGRTSRCARG